MECASLLALFRQPRLGAASPPKERPVDRSAKAAGLTALTRAQPRVLDYADAERWSRQLAAALHESLEPQWLERCRLVPLPRGGLFVAGMLSYLLRLSHRQLAPFASPGSPVLLVDDCALSGARLTQALRALSATEITFATLCSPAPLRAAVRRSEPRPGLWVNAVELEDLAPRAHPEESERRRWRQRWLERRPEARWAGLPEVVIFPWTEPDHPVWNSESGKVEEGWWLAPPDRCLKNWASLGLAPAGGGRVRRFWMAEGVAYRLETDAVLLCRLRDGALFELSGPASEIWRALAGYGDLAAAVSHVGMAFEVEPERARRDVEELVEHLLREGLMVQSPP